ncbi:MAG: toprim domain-containing protein, partial [Deltaproteobacteria bacterium]|nr:toprim domain-containing protein [Deltaproteobacteria bacterium]
RLLFRVNTLAAEYYQRCLADPERGEIARNYMILREFHDDAFLKQHLVGYAEDEWDGLARFLADRKVPMEYPLELGLIRPRKEGRGYYDFFRHRVIFPIVGPKAQIHGFGGRALPSASSASKEAEAQAKYLNSADSPIYHKGRTLYAPAAATPAIRAADRVLIVEGYLDVLACHQAGIKETVAPLGTALTAEHVRPLGRLTRNLYVLFDGDAAGRQAARRSLSIFLAEGLIPRVVILPDGEDPDSFIGRHGGAALLALLPPAPTLFEWMIDDVVAECGADTVGKSRAIELLRPFFAALNDAVQEASYVQRLAGRLGFENAVIAKALKEKTGAMRRGTSPAPATEAKKSTEAVAPPAERAILEFILQVPGAMAQVAHQLQPRDFTDPTMRAIAECCWQVYEARGELRAEQAVALAGDAAHAGLMTALAFGAGKYEDPEMVPRLVAELLHAMARPHRQERLRELNRAIAEAEHAGRDADVHRFMTEKTELLKERNLWNANR